MLLASMPKGKWPVTLRDAIWLFDCSLRWVSNIPNFLLRSILTCTGR